MVTKEEQQQEILDMFTHWADVLGLSGQYDIEYRFVDDCSLLESPDTIAQCHVEWEYARVTIKINTHKLDEVDEYVAVHELMHIFLNETREDVDDWLRHEERACSLLARGFLKVKDEYSKRDS